ncbi:MAG: PD-(D/E)XK nuclease family protein [Magnetococcales bacterium]|nr:PD-(D/E)XK nuclease family protein [Magnetococcales bacterium]
MQTIMTCLEGGGVVVTVNRRLARFCMESHDRWKLAQGLVGWPTPAILPYNGWLERRWEALTDHLNPLDGLKAWPTLLNPVQELALWEQIMAADAVVAPLLDTASMVEKVAQANALWHAWGDGEKMADLKQAFTDADSHAFLNWNARFEARCREENWISSAQIPAWLTRLAPLLPPEPQILLAGFDRFSPAQERLWAALATRNTTVSLWQPSTQPTRAERLSFSDPEQEISAAAHWTRERLIENPQARIGIIVPDLQRLRSLVARIFSGVLHPELFEMPIDPGASLVNVSLGWPLLDYPLIREMFLVLDGMDGLLSLTDIGALLRSPFIAGGESERLPRALLDRRLRDQGHLRLTFNHWQQLAESKSETNHCPRLHAILGQVAALLPTLPGRQPPQGWSKLFSTWLATWGWPGERPLSSREFQTWEAGRTLLESFSSLSRITGSMTLAQARATLRTLARRRLFQPDCPEARVEIMGLLESAGEPFTAVWLLGFTAESWPTTPDPNPFLPLAWQRQKGLPRASAAVEWAFATRLTERLLTSAPHLLVSHARLIDDLPREASPLFAHLPEISETGLTSNLLPPPLLLGGRQPFEVYTDDQGPAMAAGSTLAGGAGVLQTQAECPFRAFAQYRLAATPLVEVELVIDNRVRGTLTHRLLEEFWRMTPSLQDLRDLDPVGLEKRISKAAAQVVQQEAKRRPDWFPTALQRLEEERLRRLLTRWLDVEKTRTAPFRVLSREKPLHQEVGGMTLELRPDRVDALPDDRLVVIDYKTGDPNLGAWSVPRLREPQLPLYALALGPSVAALAFAKVRPEKPELIGLEAETGMLPLRMASEKGLQRLGADSWSELLALWQEDLAQTAREFLSGHARVTPLPNACTYCRTGPLCRIHEAEVPPNPNDQGETPES